MENQSLWNKISVPEYTTEEEAQKSCKCISTCLTASRSRDLHISHTQALRCHGTPPEIEVIQYSQYILELFIRHERHWRTLEIVLDDYLLECFLWHLEAAKLRQSVLGANIRRLHIILDDSVRYIDLRRLVDLSKWIAGLPTLEVLEFTEYNDELDVLDNILEDISILPLERLKRVEFEPYMMTFDECLGIASRCITATELRLASNGCDWPDPQDDDEDSLMGPPTMISLPKLTRLSLDGVEAPVDLLKYLHLPNLEYLRIIARFARCHSRCKTIQDFLTQTQCPLKTFEIADSALSPEDTWDICQIPALARVPNVTFSFRKGPISVQNYVQRLVAKISASGLQAILAGKPSFAAVWDFYDDKNVREGLEQPEFWFGRKEYWEEREAKSQLILYENGALTYGDKYNEVLNKCHELHQQGIASDSLPPALAALKQQYDSLYKSLEF